MSNPKIYHPSHSFVNQPFVDLSNLDLTLNELQSTSSPSQPLLYNNSLSPSQNHLVFDNINSSQASPSFNDTLILNHMSNELFYPLLTNSPPNPSINGYFNSALSFYQPFNAPTSVLNPTPDSNSDNELITELLNLPSSPSLIQPLPANVQSKAIKRKTSNRSLDINESEDISAIDDAAARKRKQNTLAARRSRQRKVARMEELENNISNLEKEKIQLETKVAILESERESNLRREKENMERIRNLENQLLEAIKNARS